MADCTHTMPSAWRSRAAAGQGRAGLGRPERRAEPEAYRDRGRAGLGRAEGTWPPGGCCTPASALLVARSTGVDGRWAPLLPDRSISAADAIGKTADKIGVGVEALQELRFAAKASGVEQQTLDMALQRFSRRAAEAAQGTGEAKDALAQMGIALRDQERQPAFERGPARRMSPTPSPGSRTRRSGCGLPSSCSIRGRGARQPARGGSGALEEMRERARDLGIVLDEHLVRDAERARTELDTLSQVMSANLTRAALEAAPVIADLSSWLADVAGKAGIAWERLFDAPEEKSLRTLRYELGLASSTIEKLEGRIRSCARSPTLGFTTFLDSAQISALERNLNELRRARDQTQARTAFLEGPADTGAPAGLRRPLLTTPRVWRTEPRTWSGSRELEGTLFGITHEGGDRIIAQRERRIAEIEALRAQMAATHSRSTS